MKLRLAEAARDDLQRLVRTAAASDPNRASNLNRGLRVALRAIAASPMRCPIARVSGRTDVRKKRWPPQLVLFRVDAEGVLILHERSDWASLV